MKKLVRSVPAGLVDAGFASLASFSISVFAARWFPADLLGAYALLFSAFVVSTMIPTQLVFRPAEMWVLEAESRDRSSVLNQSIPAGVILVIISAVLVVIVPAIGLREFSSNDVIPLTVSAVLCSALSPVQDHVRRVLHLSAHSWHAATVSIVQFGVAVMGLGFLGLRGVPMPWLPFGALAVANAVSLGVGLAFVFTFRPRKRLAVLNFRRLLRSGKWLLVGGILPTGTGLLTAGLVGQFAGYEVLGLAEAARIVAQPVFVLAVGLMAVMGPRSAEAGIKRQRSKANEISQLFLLLIIGAGLSYMAICGFTWVGNPMVHLVPNAYTVRGLVVVSILASIVQCATGPWRDELIGGAKERPVAAVETFANLVRVAFAFGAVWLQSYTIATGVLGMSMARVIGLDRLRSVHYQRSDTV